jgi:hypothetical protein
MKKIVEELASKAGVDHRYSGSTRVMYLRGEKAAEFKAWIKEKYPVLAFELKLDEGLGLRFEHGDLVSVHGDRNHALVHAAHGLKFKSTKKAILVSSTEVDEELAGAVVDAAMETVFGPVHAVHALPLSEEDKVIEDEIRAIESAEEKKLRIRAELDIYLIENPIDKSKKGFFVPIAEKFDVTSDYVRKRYNSLKERGLVEKENA